MNCPRCGERMFGSVCPRCGNIVMENRSSEPRNTRRTPSYQRSTEPAYSRQRSSDVMFMDSGTKPVRPSHRSSSGNVIYKMVIVVLAVLCVLVFFKYQSAASKLNEAQTTITGLNDSIKAKDEEISQLKASVTAPSEGEDGKDDENSDAPSVEFDENGNLLTITDNDSSQNDTSSDKNEYKSGDTYTIKEGDTGSIICKTIYGEYKPELWEKLLSANGMTTSSQYHPGDELKIP